MRAEVHWDNGQKLVGEVTHFDALHLDEGIIIFPDGADHELTFYRYLNSRWKGGKHDAKDVVDIFIVGGKL